MTLETECLILRRWEESDAEDLYKYASDPAGEDTHLPERRLECL